jgi:hypothetical protein
MSRVGPGACSWRIRCRSAHCQQEAEGLEQPTHWVARAAAGHHRPDRGRAHRRRYQGDALRGELGEVGPAGLA